MLVKFLAASSPDGLGVSFFDVPVIVGRVEATKASMTMLRPFHQEEAAAASRMEVRRHEVSPPPLG